MKMRFLVLLVTFALTMPVLAQGEFNDEFSKAYQKDYELYQSLNEMQHVIHPVKEENSYRISMMQNWYRDNTEQRLLWVRSQNWSEEYKAMFARTVRWRKETFNGGAEKLYRLSHKYRKVPNAEKFNYDYLAVWLLYYAAKAGHREAELEYNDLPTDSANPILVNGPRSQDYDKAVAGDQAAINYLIITYLLFPIFDDDRQKGYYWLHRSRDFGVTKKTRDALLKSISFLSASERNQAKGWIKSGRVPPI